MEIDSVIFASGGNDSVALVQTFYEERLADPRLTHVVYSNTGWSAWWWPVRMNRFRLWVQGLGFNFSEIQSEGMEALIRRKKGWPANRPKFCTYELKIKPAMEWLELVDSSKETDCFIGIRRAESKERRSWPRVIERSPSHGGRRLIAPMVEYSEPDRDEVIIRAGWEVLPHRSKECDPCVNANRATFRQLDERDIAKVRQNEQATGRNMFRPHRFMGARGIDEVLKWACLSVVGTNHQARLGVTLVCVEGELRRTRIDNPHRLCHSSSSIASSWTSFL